MQDEKNTKPGENVEKKDFKSGLYRTIKTYVLRISSEVLF